MSREFGPPEFIPHQGYAELPNPTGTSQVRILGANTEAIFIHEQHVEPHYMQFLKRAVGAMPWNQGPTEDSPPVQGQYIISRDHAKEVRLLG